MEGETQLPAWCEILLAAAYLGDESAMERVAARFVPELRGRASNFRDELFSSPRAVAAARCRSILREAGLCGLPELIGGPGRGGSE